MTGKDWIQVAMSDDSLVAEALLLLNQAEHPPSKIGGGGGASKVKLEWSVRQRRTKTAATAAAAAARKNGSDHTSASPTTPLSWSGATSVSGGGGVEGFEECSNAVKPSDGLRSKISVTNGAPCKKSKRKKQTIAELKEDESLLLKEKSCLENELTRMRLVLEKQRARNEILKKIKVDSSRTGITERKDSAFLLPDLNLPLDNDSNLGFLQI